jgi:phenylacetic acid degradation operon negative regulatory protein
VVAGSGDGVDQHKKVPVVHDPASSAKGLRTLRSKSLVVDLYPAFIRDLGGWIAIADLVELMGDLGVEDQVARATVSRFVRKGLLERNVVDGRVGYQLTEVSARNIDANEQRVFSPLSRARIEEGWVLCTFSIPEEIRAMRHQLRSALTWLGFGILTDGLWIAPGRVLPQAQRTVRWLGLEHHVDLFEAHYRAFDDPTSLVKRCWDLSGMREAYLTYIDTFEPVLAAHQTGPVAHREAFIDYLSAVAGWRRLPYDPGIPTELLPADWEGVRAGELFEKLRQRLEPAAKRHVIRVVGRGS